MLSLSRPHQYYQIFLSQGVGMGLGVGLTFVPTLSNIAHHFYDRKALATGIALSGSSTGALIFPISESNLHNFSDIELTDYISAYFSAKVRNQRV